MSVKTFFFIKVVKCRAATVLTMNAFTCISPRFYSDINHSHYIHKKAFLSNQLGFLCSKLTIETLGQGVKDNQS